MNKKSKFYILAIGIVIFIVVIFNLTNNDKAKNSNIDQKPDISLEQNINSTPIKIDDSLSINLTEKLPIISFLYKDIKIDQLKEIAQSLNFEGEPFSTNDFNQGIKYFWSNSKSSLWYTPSLSYLTYESQEYPKLSSSTKKSDDEYKKIAISFLKDKFKFDENSIQPTSIDYLKVGSDPDHGLIRTSKEQTEIFQVNLTYKEINHPILTNIPQFQIILVQMIPSGEVIKSHAYILDKFTKRPTLYDIKNQSDIEKSLSTATLISIQNDRLSVEDINRSQIKNINIDKIETGYYFDIKNKQRALSPIILLSGEIEITQSEANYAWLYLDAIKQ